MARQSTASLTVTVLGGTGGYSGHPSGSGYGTGGGGGGGAVLLSSGVTLTPTVAGGANGLLYVPNDNAGAYGATAGATGSSASFTPTPTDNVPLPGVCVPQVTVVKTTSTPTRYKGTDTQATYTIKVSNAPGRGDALGVTVSDPALPDAFTYDSASEVALGTSPAPIATRPSTTNPTAGSTAPAWSSFTIPGGGSVAITFLANLNSTPVSTTAYQNSAKATYLDPTRTVSDGTATATYDSASSTGEDVTIRNKPTVVLEKWVRNVTTGANFTQANSGLPGQTLEYCINFRETGGTDANNFKLSDSIPSFTDVLPNAYDPNTLGYGVRLYSGIQLTNTAASTAPPSAPLIPTTASSINLTSASTDTDGAELSQAGGLTYATNLLANGQGIVCFQAKIK